MATTPSLGAPPSVSFIPSSGAVRQGPVTKRVASPGNRIPAPAGIIVPINWDSCPGVRKVICGRACGGKDSTTMTTASKPKFLHRNMRPAKRGSDRSISAVCRIAASPVSAVAVVPRTRTPRTGRATGFDLTGRASVAADCRRGLAHVRIVRLGESGGDAGVPRKRARQS